MLHVHLATVVNQVLDSDLIKCLSECCIRVRNSATTRRYGAAAAPVEF